MPFTPSLCHKLSHLLGPHPSSVTYFMDGPQGERVSKLVKNSVTYFMDGPYTKAKEKKLSNICFCL